MHASNHLKALGNEVQGSYYTGGKRKKPHNPDEVGPVKDHFSEGRQQENQREPVQQDKAPEADAEILSFEDEADDQGLYKSRKAQYTNHANQMLSGHLTAQALHSLAHETAPHTTINRKLGMTRPAHQAAEPSLDDLLTLMRTK